MSIRVLFGDKENMWIAIGALLMVPLLWYVVRKTNQAGEEFMKETREVQRKIIERYEKDRKTSWKDDWED